MPVICKCEIAFLKEIVTVKTWFHALFNKIYTTDNCIVWLFRSPDNFLYVCMEILA